MNGYKMINIITPDDKIGKYDFLVFLAGTIEMGTARMWQTMVHDGCNKAYKGDKNITFCNPYKKDFNKNVKQTIYDKEFLHQVSWEWEMLNKSDMVIFNFEEDSKSPISLLELGAMAALKKEIIICCPEKFWRYGNVEFIADHYSIDLVHDLDTLIQKLSKRLNKLK